MARGRPSLRVVVTVVVLLIIVLVLVLEGYIGYAGVTLAVAVCAGVNLV